MSYLVNNKTIIECTGNIYYSYETFQKIKKIVLKLEKENKKINIDILRENLKISRKYCLAILDKMEDEMLIKRSRE
jgi:DNA-binding Lrp family transcriptional regulator